MSESNQAKASAVRLPALRLSDCITIWALVGLCFKVPIASRLKDPDLWWHLKTGQLIVANRAIPKTDPYSFTMYGKPWVLHEWLTEVVFWFTYSGLGYGGLVLLKSLLVLATFSIVLKTARSRTDSLGAATAALVIAAAMSMQFWSERPQLFGYLFAAVLVWLIHKHRKGSSLWGAVPVFALWINFHGSWLVGVALLIAYLFETGWDAVTGRGNARLKSVAKVIPFVVLALFANPHPLSYVAYPFQYLGNNHFTSYISDFQSPSFHDRWFFGFLIYLVGLPALLWKSKAKTHPVEMMVVLGLTGVSLFSARHVPILAIVSAPFLAEHIGSIRWRKADVEETKKGTESAVLNWSILALLPVLILLTLPDKGPTPYLDVTNRYPVAAFDSLEAEPGGGRLLTDYNWGGYAIFRLWPEYQVYIDGRADVYGPGMIERAKKLDKLSPGWQEEVVTAVPDVIVWPAREPLAQALPLTGKWKRVNPEDRLAAVFMPVRESR